MSYDVIIVLAGGIRPDGTLPDSVRERIHKAKELYDNKVAPRILMSGKWSKYWEHRSPPHTEAELMVRYAVTLGIPRKKILKEQQSRNTKENAYYTFSKFLHPRRWKKVVVVTSDFHAKRARTLFVKQLGPDYTLEIIQTHISSDLLTSFRQYLKESWILYFQRFL